MNKKLLNTKYYQLNTSSQAGVTLLLAVLIMSGLVLVALAVAGFTIQEIRSSRSVALSEPALNAAETGAENALWSLKTTGGSAVPNCSGTSSSKNLNSSNSTTVYCKSYVGDTFDLVNSQPAEIFLYDPDDINGDADLTRYPYSSLTITNKSSNFSITATIKRLDGTDVGTQPVLISPNSTQIVPISPVSAGSEGRIVVTLLSAGNPTVYLTTDRGLPYNISLEANGCSANKGSTGNCAVAAQELFNRKILVSIKTGNTQQLLVDTIAPIVTITDPDNGANVVGTINVNALASDNVGVVGVRFKLDGANLGAEDAFSPYSISWDSRTTSNGIHILIAVARDATGNTGTSTAVSVTVNNPDLTPPTVAITTPANNATVNNTIAVSANASDNNGVSGVQFKLDGANLQAEDTTAPYSIVWNTATVSVGPHTLTAVARDGAGNTTTSAAVNVTVSVPTVNMTASPSSIVRGGTATVAWAGVSPASSRDWVALYPAGVPDQPAAYIGWFYTSSPDNPCVGSSNGSTPANGTCQFTIPVSATPGSYEFRMFANDGWTKLVTSNAFTVTGAQLTVSPSTIMQGGMATVSWAGISPATAHEWVALYPAGVPDQGLPGYSGWFYDSSTAIPCDHSIGTSSPSSGTCQFVVPFSTTVGSSEFRMFANDGWTPKLATSNTFTVTAAPSLSIDYLIVGGGGGGGTGTNASRAGGGGGGGGVVSNSKSVAVGSALNVIVGGGGAGAPFSIFTAGVAVGANGGDSSVTGITTALGGGGASSGCVSGNGLDGGSGGGAGNNCGNSVLGGIGSQGGNGGSNSGGACCMGGGGGGAAPAAGVSSPGGGTGPGGAGGAGFTSSISGSSQVYAAGGKGGWSSGSSVSGTTIPGGANTGNGGGGGDGTNGGQPFGFGAAGGSGIVIIRYLGAQKATGGSISSAGGYTIHTFTGNGTFTVQ